MPLEIPLSFGQLQVARAATGLLPDIVLPDGPWTRQRLVEAQYRLPPYGTPVDLYVAVSTPAGEFAMLPNCAWANVGTSGYAPLAIGYRSPAASSGTLIGPGGVCTAIPVANLPAGSYNWRIAAVGGSGLIGAVNSEPLEILP